jgi:16S rRNA (cytosine967-C5)-methyltransferase
LKDAWTLAVEALSWIEFENLGDSSALLKTTKQLGISDAGVVSEAHKLMMETIRRRNFIDKIVDSALSPRSILDLKLGVRSFLRLFTYKTKFFGVSKKEAIRLANLGRSILGWHELSPVEEALAKILAIDLEEVIKGLSDEEAIALKTFHPVWFVKYCINLFGRDESLKLLGYNVKVPPTYIRINSLRGDKEAILKKIDEAGISVKSVESPFAYKIIDTKVPLVKSQPYREGLFYIQDLSSCFAVEAIRPTPGSIVLDVCAAPGAKTTYLAQFMENCGEIYAIDYSIPRSNVLKGELARMGVKIANPIIADAYKPLPLKTIADTVLLDPPCSGTGVFWRSPSEKWQSDYKSILRIAKIQLALLDSCSEHVKVDGALFYTTCSITVEENELNIESFLAKNSGFKLEDVGLNVGCPGLREHKECRRFYPHIHESNGFFIAKLRRISE